MSTAPGATGAGPRGRVLTWPRAGAVDRPAAALYDAAPMRAAAAVAAALALFAACKRDRAPSGLKVGLVTDLGGRGDQSFNDGALRGLELWAGGVEYLTSGYRPAPPERVAASVPADLSAAGVAAVGVTPVALQSRAQEDYEPNLQVLVDDGVALAIGVGYMLENAVENVARKNPNAKFLLIDSPVLDPGGRVVRLPNVRTVVFREHEGSFLVGAIAALASSSGKVAFVGGIEIPLIKKFEAGYRAGVAAVRPEMLVLVAYTNSFDKPQVGKQVAQDLLGKGADVVFHAAGSDGLGAIAAAKDAGKFAIGVDSDQHHVAPGTVLTSMIKRVDYAVWLAARDIARGAFVAGDIELGLKEGGVGYAPIRAELPGRDAVVRKVEALKAEIIAGRISVPATVESPAARP